MREVLSQCLNILFPALGNCIIAVVFSEVETVCAVWVYILYTDFVYNTQVSADAPDIASWLQATHNVHACVEHLTEARERLKTTANGSVLLQNGHLQPFLCQNSTAEQSAQTSTDNHYIIFHVYSLQFTVYS